MNITDEDYRPERPSRPRGGWKPIWVAAGLVLGVWAVAQLGAAGGSLLAEVRKITAVMSLINNSYVEKPDLSKLTEGAIEGMLDRLDPHSVYIPAQEQKDISERDLGEFEGIGISFVIQNEVLTVVAPIAGTPADRLGIRSGDRIVEIDGVSTFGITNDEVFRKLRGVKGTSVKVTIVRDNVDEPLEFTVIRDTIPIRSVWTSFMLNDSTGYVLLNQFMATTSNELNQTLRRLEAAGMTRLILDLRNNQGGRLNEAVAVADMFIPGGQVLASRRGRRASEDSTYHSTSAGDHPMFALIVLINGGSASASEIVAGAMQDLDRGLVVGQNSFGKGLVQLPYQLEGGAVIRLSTAYWFTPSGRLVQRPYDKGRGEYYAVRYKDPDSTAGEPRQAFKSLGGRTVYASSGITPDVAVEEQTVTGATARLINGQILFEYAHTLLGKYNLSPADDFGAFGRNFKLTDGDLDGVLELARQRKIDVSRDLILKDRDFILTQLKAEIAQQIWSNRDYYYFIRTETDSTVVKALGLFPQAQAVAMVWTTPGKG